MIIRYSPEYLQTLDFVVFYFDSYVEQTPPETPKTSEDRGHQRVPSDAAVESPVSDSTQLPLGDNGSITPSQ